jgi:hypothetical protein
MVQYVQYTYRWQCDDGPEYSAGSLLRCDTKHADERLIFEDESSRLVKFKHVRRARGLASLDEANADGEIRTPARNGSCLCRVIVSLWILSRSTYKARIACCFSVRTQLGDSCKRTRFFDRLQGELGHLSHQVTSSCPSRAMTS